MGLRAKVGGGYEVVSQTGRYLSVTMTTVEDAATKAIVDPYVTALAAYNDKVVGQTTTPIDALQAYTQETSGANLQADAAVYELSVKNSIPVDFHLSGAMTNKAIAPAATAAAPVTLKIADMFTAMPYENSLVVISMNGPQLKTVLERAYRNYYFYKYVPGYGGYSYYTTCMLDTNFGNQITYHDLYPALPSGNNVVSLKIGGVPVDFTDATKYYKVSTVNYLAAGSCNFNDGGVSLWPLGQILNDTQFYVRDAVIDYITFKGTVSPAIEGRLNFVNKDTVGVFRPDNGILFLKNMNSTGFAEMGLNYGLTGDYPVTGDWDGNGSDTIGVYRDGSFYLRNSNTVGFADLVFAFGQPGDQPVVGDWDGNGTDTIGVYRDGMFLLRNTNTAGVADESFLLGNPGDVGIVGDWNADGQDTTGVFRPDSGVIFLKNANTSGFADVALNYGLAGDMPVIGDWNDDGVDTIGVYRNGFFYLRNANTAGFADLVFALGIPGDIPIVGDWDGIP